MTHTITALATAPAPGGVAIVRVSGPDAGNIVSASFVSSKSPVDNPRMLIFGSIIDPKSSEVLDQGLCVYMPGPNSYTGEDIVEFQLHGSVHLATRLIECLYGLGIQPAEPGEFTKRAFLNGKIDLAQAEAVNDLINANSDRAIKVATEQLEGRFSQAIEKIGEPLRDVLAELEAAIDFPEEDIKPESLQTIAKKCSDTSSQVSELLSTYKYGNLIKDGFRVLLAGKPNAGKSSLLNQLLGTERAIVTEISGTTRDLIEEKAVFDGYPFVFCDSAGLTDTKDRVELIGVELAFNKLSWADLVLYVIDASDSENLWMSTLTEIKSKSEDIWLVVNKVDLEPEAIGRKYSDSSLCSRNFYISAETGDGLELLKNALVDEVADKVSMSSESSGVITNIRHKDCLNRSKEALDKAVDAVKQSLPIEIVSAEVGIALTALEEIIGKTYTEDILGRIFSKFCIGK